MKIDLLKNEISRRRCLSENLVKEKRCFFLQEILYLYGTLCIYNYIYTYDRVKL